MWQLCYFWITLASLRVQNEVEILQSVNHPCVIKLEDVSYQSYDLVYYHYGLGHRH